MSLFSGSIIILSDKGINKNKRVGLGWAIRFWEWDQVASFSFNDDPIGGRNYRILQAHDAHGEVLVSAALGQDPTEQEIKSFLQAHGKPLHDVLSVVQDQVSTLRS